MDTPVTATPSSTADRPLRLIALMPIYNDWEVANVVCRDLDAKFAAQPNIEVELLMVDDGSSSARPAELCTGPFAALRAVHLLRLRRNVGHQRAIGIGLAWMHEHVTADAVLVMDSDGQDRPADVGTLLRVFEQEGRRSAVFAARQKRPESAAFRVFYALYRGLHRVLTGFAVRIGNFSVIPAPQVARLLVSSDLWSHYAAAVVRSRAPFVTVPIDRGERITGRSTMDFVALVAHGLSAISVFRERVGTRLLVGAVSGAALLAALLAGVVVLAIVSQPSLPLWLWIGACSAALLTVQVVLALFVLAFIIMSQRDLLGFLPIRDYVYFVDECQRLR